MLLLIPFLVSLASASTPTDMKRLYVPSAQATSFLQNNWNKYQENYHPNYAFDDNPATAWVEGIEGNGEGEELSWKTSPLKTADRVELNIRNGYQKSQKLFDANAAPKKISVSLLTDAGKVVVQKEFELKHEMGWQKVDLDVPGSAGFSRISLKIVSTYAGKTYKDTCVSDIQVFVASKVPYDKTAELDKNRQLQGWVKDRLKQAKYFASLPAEYPFAASVFIPKPLMKEEEEGVCSVGGDEPKTKSNYVAFDKQLEKKTYSTAFKKVFDAADRELIDSLFVQAKKLRANPGWSNEVVDAKLAAIAPPDAAGIDASLEENRLTLIGEHYRSDLLSYFESAKATSEVKRRTSTYDPVGTFSVRSNMKLQKDGKGNVTAAYFWTKEAMQERGISETQEHHLLVYENGRLQTVMVWSKSGDSWSPGSTPKKVVESPIDENSVFRPNSLAIYRLSWNADGKIEKVSVKSVENSEYDCGVNTFKSEAFTAVKKVAAE